MDKHTGYIVREGFPFIIGFGVLALALSWMGLGGLAAAFFAVTLFVAFFFRNPERTVPTEKDILVSPAVCDSLRATSLMFEMLAE